MRGQGGLPRGGWAAASTTAKVVAAAAVLVLGCWCFGVWKTRGMGFEGREMKRWQRRKRRQVGPTGAYVSTMPAKHCKQARGVGAGMR